jgi:NAD(P)-dependent dehydrogenase (short-subunit alcohol dehydrogenase family)
MNTHLHGSRIIVTGGGQGIGAALVGAFACEGANVASLDIKEAAGREQAERASAEGPGRAEFHLCDVADRGEVERVFSAFTAEFGALDVLVNAAGIELRSPAEDITDEDWDRTFDVNAKGTLITNQAAFRSMRDHGGRILNFASGAGVRGYRLHGHYAATKGAVLSWTRTIALEWGRYGITANAICPGIWTPMYDATRARMTADELADHEAQMADTTPIDGRLGDATRDLAPFMVFLAGEGSRYITGQTLVVDGGRTMVR